MASVTLDWTSIEFLAADVSGWRDFKSFVPDKQHLSALMSRNAVYVFRVKRPFAFAYMGGQSPVAYIGKGNAKQRITSHLKTWIPELKSRFPELVIRVSFCEPRVRRLGRICSHVEADLIARFISRFGEKPLRNKQIPSVRGSHTYSAADLKVLYCGSGRGYQWAIRPMASSPFFRSR